MRQKDNCFICGNPANIKYVHPIIVRCKYCDAFYEFDSWIENKRIDSETGLFTYFSSKTNNLILLEAPHKQKLLDYIHQNQNWDENNPAKLDGKIYATLVED